MKPIQNQMTHYDYLRAQGVDIRNTKLNDLAAFLSHMPEGWLDRSNAPHIENCKYGCGGVGYFRHDVPHGHPLFGVTTVCQCTKDKTAMTTIQRIENYTQQLSNTERAFTLKNWIGTDARARSAASEAVQTLRGIKVFIGPYGTGKTGLLTAIANSVLERRIEASYWVVNTLLSRLQASYKEGVEAFDREMNTLATVRVLILDEISVFKPSEWAVNTIRTLIDERYRRWDSLLTVIGGNEMPEHDAIISRFHDSVRSQIVYLEGADLRPLAKDLSELAVPKAVTDEDWHLAEADLNAHESDERGTWVAI